MVMTPGDAWLHEQHKALTQPSFIKNIPSQLSESSASWLVEKLSELSSTYSGEDLDAIFSMLEEQWSEFTEIEAEEEIERHPSYSPILCGIIEKIDYKYGPPSEIYYDDDQVVLEDKESLKAKICDEYDTQNPTSLERFRILLSFTDWSWTYTNQYGDEVEVESYKVAIVVAIEMLGFYLQSLIHKEERDQSGYLAFDIDEVHQAHHLAHELKSAHELNSKVKQLQLDIPKKTISERAAKGGQARAVRYLRIREHIIEAYESRISAFNSLRHASMLLVDEAEQYCKQHAIDRLAPANAQRTIYEWLRKHEKHRNM